MSILAVVREDQIGSDDGLQVLEELLDIPSAVRKEAVPEIPYENLLFLGALEEGLGAGLDFVRPFPVGAQDDPADLDARTGGDQSKDRPPTADFDVVRVA